MDWDKLRIFYAVAQTKNVTRAGEMLSLSPSAISRQITTLEEKFKVPLFHRHPRGLVMTEQGEILYRTVCEMVGKLQNAETIIAESGTKPRGEMKITAPVAFGSIWLAPVLKEFLVLYPDIDITLIVDDRELDLGMREADIGIRMFETKQPDLIQIPLFKLSSSVFASTDYLTEFGTPKTVADLANHRLITYPVNLAQPSPHINWLQELPAVKRLDIKPYIQLNSLNAMRRAVKVGMGMAALPHYIMYRARHISKVLPELKSPLTQVYLVYSLELKNSRRLSVFRSFLERKIAEYNF